MAKRNVLKWSGDEIIQFLDIYQKYDVLWNVWDENYGKKKTRGNMVLIGWFKKLMMKDFQLITNY